MEKLTNLTQIDINNGVLIRILANAGIPDVQEYVKTFHQKTEELIIEEFERPNQNKIDNEEQIVPPTSIQNWITSLQPHFDDPTKSSLPEEGQQQLPQDVQSLITNLRPVINNNDHINSTEQQLKQQQHKLPAGVQDWITGLRPSLDDLVQPSSCEQQQQKQSPTDFTSWIQHITPVDLVSSTDIIRTETNITSNNVIPVTGNLGTWLNDWSKSLGDQPPPTSLDNWLQNLVPKDMNEPIGRATNPKNRLNAYLNAAQEVLSQHGYNVSNEVRPPANVEIKTGTFGSVKQMYFLWKTLDKNNDRKITVEDVQIMLQEMGLGFLSKYVAQALFDMVDSNHDGKLQFRDFVALMGIIKQLISAVGSAKVKT